MQTSPQITVVGSFAVGLTIRAQRFPAAGETLIGRDFDMGPGGKGSNQAVGVARLGGTSNLVAKIGTDMFGDVAVNLYQQEGVGTQHLQRISERPTGVGVLTLNDRGDNHIIIDLGANDLLSPADVDAAADTIRASRVVLAVLEIPVATAAYALRLAHAHGALTILNPAPAQPLDDETLAAIDIITPNETELRILAGLAPDAEIDVVEVAQAIVRRGARNIMVTRGARGVLIINAEDGVIELPGFAVEPVDTTGAGDAFNAALAVALAEGKSLVDAARFACASGALACTKLGVIPALPHRADVEGLVSDQRPTTNDQR